MSTISDEPIGILLSRDLIFTSKVTGTASALGHKVMVVGNVAAASAMMARSPKVVFVDLASGDLVASASLAQYRELAPTSPFVAFGSHVDVESLAAAKAAGCDPVMPRSRFTVELADLIRRYFAEG